MTDFRFQMAEAGARGDCRFKISDRKSKRGRSVCAPGVIAGPEAGSCLAPRTQPLVPAFIIPARIPWGGTSAAGAASADHGACSGTRQNEKAGDEPRPFSF
jgi:hypothetical protein